MKKITLSAVLVLMFALLSAATIEKTYYFSNPKIIQKGEYQTIEFQKSLQTALSGEPKLPYQSIRLLLPPGEIVTNVEFIGEELSVINGRFQLAPYQSSLPLSIEKKAEFQKNDDIYSSSTIYPNNPRGNFSTSFMNGYGFAFSSFTPLQYIPAEGKVSYFKKVTIRITTALNEKGLQALANHRTSSTIKEKVLSLAQNPKNYDLYPNTTKSADDYRYLVITKNQFVDDFADFKELYYERGVKLEIATTEYIAANVNGADLIEKIRNYIIDQYQNHGVEFVLLGGDVEHVPFRGFYCFADSGSGYSDDGIPADLYYSALDGNWNNDGDDKWGEPDEDDLLPEIAVGRFPFSNTSELENLIHKSISYQNSPVLGELSHAFMAGEHLYSDPETWGSDYLEMLIGAHDDNGYSTTGIPEDYTFTKLYESNGSWSGNDFINEINQGKQFVHHVGHANSNYVAHLYNEDITNSNFSGSNGVDHNYTILQTHGCICGNYEDNDCILERMVNIDNCAVSVIGNSRYGWFNEGQTEGPAAHLHREMMNALYHEKMNHLGAAFLESKTKTAPWVEAPGQWEEGALRWNFYDINILGDPFLATWTDEPIDISTTYPTQIPIGASTMNISVNSNGIPMENFSCALKYNDEIYGWGLTASDGSVNISFDIAITEVGEAELVVFGYNCLPHTYAVQIIPNEGAYVVYTGFTINDASGNNNSLADYSETIMLDISLENVGNQNASNLSATLTSSNTFISISDDSEELGTINSGATLTFNDAFTFDVANNVPDQEVAMFEVEITNGTDSWNSNFQIVLNAPLLEIGAITINDAAGNGNGILDPGESVILMIESINNGHSDCSNATALLTSSSPYVTIEQSNFDLGDLLAGATQNATFTTTISEAAPIGNPLNFSSSLESGEYLANQDFILSVGMIVEDFETGDFSQFEWIAGSNPWTVVGDSPYEGDFAAQSGDISDDEESELSIEMEIMAEDEITFWYKVSSEASYDFLRFYIDGSKKGEWAGEVNWAEATYTVSEGTHTFKWSYEKDVNTSNGADAAWVDYIVFPSTANMVAVQENIYSPFALYPNPSEGVVHIANPNKKRVQTITVYNLLGERVYSSANNSSSLIDLNLEDLEKGIFYLELISEKGKYVEKIVLQ